jgi:hypothetical protein
VGKRGGKRLSGERGADDLARDRKRRREKPQRERERERERERRREKEREREREREREKEESERFIDNQLVTQGQLPAQLPVGQQQLPVGNCSTPRRATAIMSVCARVFIAGAPPLGTRGPAYVARYFERFPRLANLL